MPSAQKIVDELREWNVTHVIGIPDNGSAEIYKQLHVDAEIEVITVSREGEAFAIASGLYVGGKHPVVLIQNTGFLESGDAIRGTAINMKIPLVTLIGYRGYSSMGADDAFVDTAATFLEPTLKAWGVPYNILETDDEVGYISDAFREVGETSMPSAVLIVGICT